MSDTRFIDGPWPIGMVIHWRDSGDVHPMRRTTFLGTRPRPWWWFIKSSEWRGYDVRIEVVPATPGSAYLLFAGYTTKSAIQYMLSYGPLVRVGYLPTMSINGRRPILAAGDESFFPVPVEVVNA